MRGRAGAEVARGTGAGVAQGAGAGVALGSGAGVAQGSGAGVAQGSGAGIAHGTGAGVARLAVDGLSRWAAAASRAVTLAAALAVALAACGPASTPAVDASPTSSATTVRVFFVARGTDPCGTVMPVVREVAGPVDAALALRELLRGPTEEEAAAGYTSLFGRPTADALEGVQVVGGVAHVSFRDLRQVLPNASSSCGSAALLAALDATLAQVPGVVGARYSFGGDEAAFYEWLQMAPPD